MLSFRGILLPMKTMKLSSFIMIFAFIGLSVGALNLNDVLPGLSAGDRAELAAKKELARYTESRPEFAYLPESPLAEKIRKQFAGFKPTITDEVLFLMPLPPGNGDPVLYLYNKLRAISTLSGIQYRSRRQDGMRALFTDVYAVDGMKTKKKIPDASVQEIPEEVRFPVHMEDANFGSGYYEASYLSSGNEIAFGLRNLTSLKYVFPILGAEKVRFQILIIPLEEGLLMYGIVAAEAGGFVRSMVNLPSALGKRIGALKDWFEEQVY